MDTKPRSAYITESIYSDIQRERLRQDELWGLQQYSNGTGGQSAIENALLAKQLCQKAAKYGVLAWREILQEEVYEAFAETDLEALRTELIQVAAVAVAWCEDLDRQAQRRGECSD